MTIDGLGKLYSDGEVVVREGEVGNCMFVIQAGSVEVVRKSPEGDVRIATLTAGDTFGEMAIFDREVRSATVRSLGRARILTIDKRAFLRRVQEDPTLALQLLRGLSTRIRHLNDELSDLRHRLAALQFASLGQGPNQAPRDAGAASEAGNAR